MLPGGDTEVHNVSVITFDADGTLWDFDATMRYALEATIGELRRLHPGCADDLNTEKLIAHRQSIGQIDGNEGATMEALRLAAFRHTLDEIGLDEPKLAEHLTTYYLDLRFASAILYDDALPTLDALRQHYRLGLISNGNSYPERCGLPGYFEFTVFGSDHGVMKPNPRLYRIAAEAAGCAPNRMLHIGDSLTNDVAAAQQAGFQAFWLNRANATNTTSARPHRKITTLLELSAAIGQ